ncbi:hypothetical protein PMZ80_008429 [Knufia obscura]|uniref:Uncharacterized protein n=2 Tax=Knufia TaxID=430999 RepID=A0AAN8EK24_9EURO|nr:hypothetical protein PMZ80_008429 [Knufia obscura]KAK5951315.1 hypothetical protein OHC33_007733 [Knufia fluminis]
MARYLNIRSNSNAGVATMISSLQPKRPGTRRMSSGEAHKAPFDGPQSQQRRRESISLEPTTSEGDEMNKEEKEDREDISADTEEPESSVMEVEEAVQNQAASTNNSSVVNK